MSKMLQVFTFSYPENKREGPKMQVLFTNFSRFEDEDEISFDDDYYEEESDGDKPIFIKFQKNPQEKQVIQD
jgi:hypothetical protein